MPFVFHRDEIDAGLDPAAGRRRFELVQGELAAELDAEIRLNVLAPKAATTRHYHTGCEHYIFIVSGEGDFTVNDSSHPVKKGYFITVEPEERHAIINTGEDKLEFLAFLVPASTAATIEEE